MKKYVVIITKAMGFFVGWAVLVSITVLPIFDTPLSLFGNSNAVKRLWWEFLPLLSVLLMTLVFTRIVDRGQIKIKVFGNVGKDSFLGILFGIIWIGGTVLILFVCNVMHFEGRNIVPNVWIWIMASLLNVIMQEFLVRGYLFFLFKEKINTLAAVLFTTILFASLHGGAFEAGIIPVLNVISMSVFVSLLLIYTENLLAPIIVHFIWNTVGCIVLGGVSLAVDYKNILICTFEGNTLLSGGVYKMEGSIVVLFINVLLITALCQKIVKKVCK